jgi:hypothetical protein
MANDISRLLPRILSWKKQYGNVFYIKIVDAEYVFRALTRAEYAALLSAASLASVDTSDLLLQECLLYPEYSDGFLDGKLAGEVETLVERIMVSSGFSETDKVEKDIEDARNSMSTLENQMIILICKAFPHLTLSDINSFTYEELIRYIALSEVILDVKLKIEKPDHPGAGKINFDEDNKAFNSPPPFEKQNKHRGAPDK